MITCHRMVRQERNVRGVKGESRMDKVERLEMQLNLIDQKMDEMFDMDEEIMEQHEKLFKKLQNSNTGYSYN